MLRGYFGTTNNQGFSTAFATEENEDSDGHREDIFRG
jgi:hypothetical protein